MILTLIGMDLVIWLRLVAAPNWSSYPLIISFAVIMLVGAVGLTFASYFRCLMADNAIPLDQETQGLIRVCPHVQVPDWFVFVRLLFVCLVLYPSSAWCAHALEVLHQSNDRLLQQHFRARQELIAVQNSPLWKSVVSGFSKFKTK